RRRRVAAGLGVGTTGALVARIVLGGGGILLPIAVLDAGRGVPLAMLILLGFVVAFDWVTTRTGWGRHVFAVGGKAEAAQGAGGGRGRAGQASGAADGGQRLHRRPASRRVPARVRPPPRGRDGARPRRPPRARGRGGGPDRSGADALPEPLRRRRRRRAPR